MNAEQAKKINIEEILAHFGYTVIKQTESALWYRAHKDDKTPSLQVSTTKNIWHNWSSGEGGNVIDFVMREKNFSFQKALSYISENFSFDTPKKSVNSSLPPQKIISKNKNYKILKINDLKHKSLINYLKLRCIDIDIAQKYCKEIYWETSSGSTIFAIAFENISGGYAVRNAFYKGDLITKNISLVNNNLNKVKIFEGFIDFLSFLSDKNTNKSSDFIILNSVAFIQGLQKNSFIYALLSKYSSIECFFDNDLAGHNCFNQIESFFPMAIDKSNLYSGFHDYNDFLLRK